MQTPDRTTVPCNGCTACCKGLVVVHKHLGDVVSDYETEIYRGHTVLKRVNDQCIYLSKDGCTIWDRAPAVCRDFDCREVVRLGLPQSEDVYAAGKRCLSKDPDARPTTMRPNIETVRVIH